MQRVICSTLLVGALSLAGLTACGDKVTVTEARPDSSVTSVTVSPPSANLNVGDKITLVATVTGGAGLTNRNVTWSTGNAAVATVDANGQVTAVGGGTTSIIATSAANTAVKGAAAITVGAVVQPTVEISTINQTTAAGSVPATLSNIAGQLDVTLNVDPGTQKLSKVNLIMNCGGADTVVATQTVASGDVAPLSAEESTAPITLSFNTAAFNAANGTVAFKNGACTLKASAVTTTGTIVASSGTPITLNNADFVSATMTTTPSTGQNASAADAKGLVWRAGAVNVTAVPILYSGTTVVTATITLVNGGVDNAIGQGSQTAAPVTVAGLGGTVATLSGLTPASGVITASFPNSTSAAGGVGGATVDTLFAVVTTVNSSGNAGPSQTLPAVVAPATAPAVGTNFIRLDNRNPDIATVAPTVNLNVQNAQNGWLGSAFVFKTTGTVGVDKSVILDVSTTSDWSGVDVVKANPQARVSGSGASFATFTSVSSLAESANATTYDLRLQICDALNNCATTGTLTQFGVDLTAPTLSQVGGVKDGDVYNIATGAPTNVAFAVADPLGAGGVSGSGTGANGLLVKDQALKPNGIPGSLTDCPIGTPTGSSPSITCSAPVLQPNTITLPGAATVSGEYTMTVSAIDQAGNTSAAVTIKYYIDLAVPTIAPQGVTLPNPITTGTAFNGFTATDNMDVKAGYGSLIYAAGSFAETGSASPVGATFDNVLTQSSTVGVSLTTFYRSLTTAVGTVGTVPSSLNVNVIDAAGNLSTTPLTIALPAANIGTPGAALNTGSNAITAFAIDSTKPSPATADPGKPITLYVNATPASDLTGSPLPQVCFFYQVTVNNQFGSGAAAGDLVKIGCTPGAGTVGVGPTRRFFYPFTWTPSSAFINSGPISVFAVGNTSGLDAIISSAVTVTVNPTPP
jgi:hypothetical protein